MLKSKPTNTQIKTHKYRPYAQIKSEPTPQILNPFWHFGPRHLKESLRRWRRRRWWVSPVPVYGCVAPELHPSRCPCSSRSTLVQTFPWEIGRRINRFLAHGSLPFENLRIGRLGAPKTETRAWRNRIDPNRNRRSDSRPWRKSGSRLKTGYKECSNGWR